MRRILLALSAALFLSGCASAIDGAYEDEQRRNCRDGERGVERVMC